MIKSTLMASLVFMLAGALHAAQGASLKGIDFDLCENIASRLAKVQGVKLDANVMPDRFVIQHPLAPIHFACRYKGKSGIGFGSSEPNPSAAWFSLVASAAEALTEVSALTLEQQIRKCYRDGFDHPAENMEAELGRAKVECHAAKDDGGHVSISVWVFDTASNP